MDLLTYYIQIKSNQNEQSNCPWRIIHARSVIIRCQAFAPYIFLFCSSPTSFFLSLRYSSAVFIHLVFSKVFLYWSTPILFFLIVIFMRPPGLTESGSHSEVTLPVQAVPLIPWCGPFPFFYLVLSKDNNFGFLSS